MTPTRLLILQRLTAHLELTSAEAGLPTVDLTDRVFRGRSITGTDVGRPALSILESPRPDVATFAGDEAFMRRDYWTLLIQGVAEDDKRNPSDAAYYLAAAVEVHLSKVMAAKQESGRPLYPNLFALGGLITSMDIAPALVRPPERDISATAFFFLPLRLGVAVQTGQPYTST